MRGSLSVQRWASAVASVVRLPEDPRTVRIWSKNIGLCETQLRGTCRMVGVPAKASLDFARLLRAVLLQEDGGCNITDFFDVADGRTLPRLLGRAGIPNSVRLTPNRFLAIQQLVKNPAALTEIKARVLRSDEALLRTVAARQLLGAVLAMPLLSFGL